MANEQDPFSGLQTVGEETPTSPTGPAPTEDAFAGLTEAKPEEQDPFAGLAAEPLSDLQKHYQSIMKEKEPYGFMDLLSDKAAEARGGRVLTKTTNNKDIASIADNWKVSPEELRSLSPYMMALPPMSEASLSDYIKRYAAGVIGYGLLGDVPQWFLKKLQDDPNMRNALDDVRDLSEGRMGAAEFVGFNLLPTPKLGALGKATAIARPTMGKALAKGAAVGAVYGLAGSKEGEELEGAALGAAIGAPLGGVAHVIDKWKRGDVAPRAVKSEAAETNATLDPATKQISLEYAEKNENKIAEVADAAWSHVEDSEKVVADAAIRKRALTDDEVNLIVKEQLSPDTVSLLSEGKTGEEANRAAAEKLVSDRREAFADSLAKENPAYGEKVIEDGKSRAPTPDEILARAAGAGKEEYFIDKFLGDAYVRTAQEQVTKFGMRASPDTAPLFKLAVNALSDKQYGLKTIDEIRGTNLLFHFLDLNTNINHSTAVRAQFDKELSDIFRAAKKTEGYYEGAKVDLVKDANNDSGGLLFKALDSNKENELPAGLREVAIEYRKQWDREREWGNTARGENVLPLNIAKREDFGAPNQLVRPVDYIIKMKQKRAEADADLLAKMGKTIDQIKTDADYKAAMKASQALREYHGGLKFSYAEPIQDALSFQDAVQSVARKGATNPRLHMVASTTLQREEKIPDFLREKNLFRLTKRYGDSIVRTVMLRKPLDELMNQAKILGSIKGAEQEARYVERLVADNLGVRAFSMARVGNEAKIKFAEVVDNTLQAIIKDPVERKKWVDSFRVLPELMTNIQYNIYPNVLGMNPRAHIAQLTQTFFKNAPELGGTYGYELATKGFTQALLTLRNKDARKLLYGKVEEYGLEPHGFVKAASEATADGIERAISYNIGAKAVREVAQKFMYSYGKMDTFNRASTVYMAEKLVSDLNGGVDKAFNAVNKMPISIRRALVKNKGNEIEQAKVVAKYLNSVTQYNYNRASMSEIGVVLGPLFSTFTKWPLATAGDIIADLRTKGLKAGGSRAVEKYGVSLLLASILDNAIRYGLGGELDVGGDFSDYDDRTKLILGSSGFVGMTPLSAARALLPSQKEKSLFTPPIVDTIYNGILAPMMDGDTDKALAQGQKAIKTYVPGAFLYRFLLQDIPTIVTGEKPQ